MLLRTYTGHLLDLANIKASDILLVDIAHALSHQCRFNGHTSAFYSVAEHSVKVSTKVPKHLALEALLHDAHEAYIGDITRPVRELLGSVVIELEQKVQRAIHEAYLPNHLDGRGMHPDVKFADDEQLKWEFENCLLPRVYGASLSALEARNQFLCRFHELCK